MTERKFTDEEVIKALECCANGECDECPYQDDSPCKEYLNNAALDLINRQRAEIERLQKKTASQNNVNFKTGDCAKIVSNVSGHEFEIGTIVKLKRGDGDYKAYANGEFWWVVDDELEEIDNPEKEMTESKPCTEGADCLAAEGEE